MIRLNQLKVMVNFTSGPPTNYFSGVPMAPPDPIIGTGVAHEADKSLDKVNLGVGAYRDDNGKPYVFKVVQEVEDQIRKFPPNHEYLPIDGHAKFVSGARNFMFGANSQAIKNGRIASCQVLSGTGALSIGFAFLSEFLPRLTYISDPTWGNHKNIIDMLKMKWAEYPYYKNETRGFNFEGMIEYLSKSVSGSIVLLHVCAHNPTGVDPTPDQWKSIAAVMKKNNLIPFFDSAYQGFASGCVEKDVWAVRYFLQEGFQFFVAQSFAKNMGLYGERIGALHVVTPNKEAADKVLSQLKVIIRKYYSSPPLHGALIASEILNNSANLEAWKDELKNVVAARIIRMRKLLRDELESIGTPGTWNHITDQIGMFSYTGVTPKTCEILTDKYHIYLLKSGRISMTGLYPKNVKYVAQSFKAAILEANGK